ncbi:MAG TPA: septum site-determining protein Ssd [Nocardioidaceae bacterium]|nr:septum site-determining protein Ssd [Nocardioidaceae bacterium]
MSHTEDRVARPLVATADDALLDDLLRLAAAAGTTPEVIADAGSVRRAWSTAGIVVLGDDLAAALATARPPRRDGVVVVGRADRAGRAPGRATTGDESSATPDDDSSAPAAAASVWSHAVAVGAEDVVWLPAGEAELIDRFGACLDGVRRATTVAVVGGSGGCGASTFAAALALAAGDHGMATLLVDADPLGSGLDLHLGADELDGMRWPDLATATGRLAAPALREALPRVREVALLSWDRDRPRRPTADAMRSVLTAGRRGHDVVVIDLPRRLDSIAEEVLSRADHTVLLVRGDIAGVAAATTTRQLIGAVAETISVVTVRSATGIPGDLVADMLGLPLVATMRPDRRLAEDLDRGLGPLRRRRGPLVASCGAVLAAFGLLDRAA